MQVSKEAPLPPTQELAHPPDTCCFPAGYARGGIRHIESKGVGYQGGYTTLEFLIRARQPDLYSAIPFFDLRGHAFNNGKLAANAGFGFRYGTSNRIFGANAFYDYRGTSKGHYNQVGIGFEALGEIWDFRANGYLPVGTTNSSWTGADFYQFQGHNLFVRRKREIVMKGVDAEIGGHFPEVKSLDTYAAAGPYYFEGKGKNAWGGKARVGCRWKDYVSLEVSGSYDSVFRGIIQGQVGVYFSLGPQSKAEPKRGECCSDFQWMMSRLVRQPVVRQEIIVADQQKKKALAVDPTTGLPLVFWFVNNLSGSNGTIESPFPALSSAIGTGLAAVRTPGAARAGEYIYIFPGDGTATGLNPGNNFYFLLDRQQVLGAATPHTVLTQFGAVQIPPQASIRPFISVGSQPLFEFANNNTFSGLHVLLGSGQNFLQPNTGNPAPYSNLTVTNCVIDQASNSGGIQISPSPNGVYTISNNTFIQGSGIPINITTTAPLSATFIIQNNGFYGLASAGTNAPITGNISANTTATFFITENTISGFNRGIRLTGAGSVSATIVGNTISQFSTTAAGTGIVLNVTGPQVSYLVQGNTIEGVSSVVAPQNGIVLTTANTILNLNAIFRDNRIDGMTSNGISAINQNAVHESLIFVENTITNTASQAVAVSTSAGTLCARYQENYTTSGSLFTNGGGTFNVEPFSGNTLNPVTVGTTSVPPCTCAACSSHP